MTICFEAFCLTPATECGADQTIKIGVTASLCAGIDLVECRHLLLPSSLDPKASKGQVVFPRAPPSCGDEDVAARIQSTGDCRAAKVTGLAAEVSECCMAATKSSLTPQTQLSYSGMAVDLSQRAPAPAEAP